MPSKTETPASPKHPHTPTSSVAANTPAPTSPRCRPLRDGQPRARHRDVLPRFRGSMLRSPWVLSRPGFAFKPPNSTRFLARGSAPWRFSISNRPQTVRSRVSGNSWQPSEPTFSTHLASPNVQIGSSASRRSTRSEPRIGLPRNGIRQRPKSDGRNFPSDSWYSISSRVLPVRSGMRKNTKIQAATLNNA